MTLLQHARETAQAPRILIATPLPTNLPHALARRAIGDITSGTLTVTVAPDRTCGFNGDGKPVLTCSVGTSCSWESGKINSVWCGWSSLKTTCYDSTAFFDSATCNSDCQSNPLNGLCTSSGWPYCYEIELGNGIRSYRCTASAPSQRSLESTQYNKPREFKTVVFVHGFQTTEWVSTLAASTINSATEESTTATSSPGNGPNIGAIVGGVLGGLAIIGLIFLGVFGLIILHRRKNNAANHYELTTGLAPQPDTPGLADKTRWSPVQAGSYTDNLSPGFTRATSPTLHEAPTRVAAWSAELDNRRADHHRGTMQEM